jgi:hypothetical protein
MAVFYWSGDIFIELYFIYMEWNGILTMEIKHNGITIILASYNSAKYLDGAWSNWINLIPSQYTEF